MSCIIFHSSNWNTYTHFILSYISHHRGRKLKINQHQQKFQSSNYRIGQTSQAFVSQVIQSQSVTWCFFTPQSIFLLSIHLTTAPGFSLLSFASLNTSRVYFVFMYVSLHTHSVHNTPPQISYILFIYQTLPCYPIPRMVSWPHSCYVSFL